MDKIRKVNPKSDIARFIKAARTALNMKGLEFGDRFGTTKANVSAWEVGAHEPSYEKLLAMSQASGIPLPGTLSLATVDGDDVFAAIGSTGYRTPVVGEARLGDNGFFEENPYPSGSDGWVQYPGKNGTYALRCKGDSMRPRIKPGEFVVIEPSGRVHEGDEVVCQTTDGRRMIKILNRRFDGMVELTSINDKHDPITLDDDEIAHMHSVAAILKPSMYYPDA